MAYSTPSDRNDWYCAVLVCDRWLEWLHSSTHSGEVSATAERYNPGRDTPLAISYEIGRSALVDIYILDANGQRYDLRRAQPRAAANDPYILRFDGSVPTDDPQVLRRLLPPGQYTLVVAARAADGNDSDERRLPLSIEGNVIAPPEIENLMVWPPVISPNADAIDDVAEFTYRLPVSATVNIEVQAPNGEIIPVVTREEEGPYEQRHVWNGKRPNGSLLEAGVYTYTVRAEDGFGNVVQRQGQITLADVGQPEARIVYSMIAPSASCWARSLRSPSGYETPAPCPSAPTGHRAATNTRPMKSSLRLKTASTLRKPVASGE